MTISFNELFLIGAIVAVVFGARLMPMLGEWIARRLYDRSTDNRPES